MDSPAEPSAMEPCPSCGRDDRLLRLVTAEATHGTVAVLAERFPVEVCTCGEAEVSRRVRQATGTAWRAALPIAHGRWLRADACRACGATLTMPARRTVRSVTVTPEGAAVATLRFDLPMRRCADCGVDQTPDRSRGDLPGVIEEVFVGLVAAAGPSAGGR